MTVQELFDMLQSIPKEQREKMHILVSSNGEVFHYAESAEVQTPTMLYIE